MQFNIKDKTKISFGKLSDPEVLKDFPLASDNILPEHFTQDNFQFIVDNIVDMFGYQKGFVQAQVESQDIEYLWSDYNRDRVIDDDEISFRFVMNAEINIYQRVSTYGQNFMYCNALKYGYPLIFGIAAHEVGHLINRYAMNKIDTGTVNGQAAIIETHRLNAKWDELCADYLAGIVLSKARPRLNCEPLKNMLILTEEDEYHPDGFWRIISIDMGYQWGCQHSDMLTTSIITSEENRRALLESFLRTYYQNVYLGVDAETRQEHCRLSSEFYEPSNLVLGYI